MNKFLKFGLLAFLMSFAIQAVQKCGQQFKKNDGTQATCVLESGHKAKKHSDKMRESSRKNQPAEQDSHHGPVLPMGLESSTSGH